MQKHCFGFFFESKSLSSTERTIIERGHEKENANSFGESAKKQQGETFGIAECFEINSDMLVSAGIFLAWFKRRYISGNPKTKDSAMAEGIEYAASSTRAMSHEHPHFIENAKNTGVKKEPQDARTSA
ncbi:MAG: hypothetical protein ABIF85_06905 [Nanoarchaeota archaeon]|nr:hypothetical protein [Nanoarchaeota archaeon]MBU4299847.1 hypothetical protein [Nanoarchaeota archaeon]MBU4451682.1 hypothetical protein [Nanoarchaeota archaeon]MCG2723613.1 hypothetical protein [archaeon]